MLIEQIVANIDAQLAALKSEIKPLEDAKAALLNGGTTMPQKLAPKRAAARTAPVSDADPVPAGKLVALLGGTDGVTTSTLAQETGGSVDQIRMLLKELADQGLVRQTGQRRGTRWHLVARPA
jgi:predicted HTH transcriptional regulator